jgi:hypothetical protein
MAASVSAGNTLNDFPEDAFTIATFCDACGHQGQLDRCKVPPGVTVQQLPALLRCSKCGAKAGSIRIIYSGAGGFRHT